MPTYAMAEELTGILSVQFATFLAVCIPALTSASPLSSKSFIAVWLLPSLVTTLLGGRWKYCALAFAGITGGYVLLSYHKS